MAILAAVTSALHQTNKFPIGNQVGVVKSDKKIAWKCYVEEIRVEQKVARSLQSEQEKPRGRDHIYLIGEPVSFTYEEEYDKIIIHAPSGEIRVAHTLPEPLKSRLIECLQKNEDIFAWSASDLKNVRPEVMEHCLNVFLDARPIFQKKIHFGPEKDDVIR